MRAIGPCPDCGKLIAYRFPIHDCPHAPKGSPNYTRRKTKHENRTNSRGRLPQAARRP